MRKIPNEIIGTISNVKGVEKIIWAYSGAKRCSDFQLEYKPSLCPIFDELSLEFDGNFIKEKGWPDWDYFVVTYQEKGDFMMDIAAGMLYDIPHCCSKAYYEKTIRSYDTFFRDHPFDGKKNLRDILEMAGSPSFYERFEKHCEACNFKGNYDIVHHLAIESIELASSAYLPKSVFLLLGQGYVPCKPKCRCFLSKSKKMMRSLEVNLPKERVDKCFREYKGKALEIR